jgi:hypothetical protein
MSHIALRTIRTLIPCAIARRLAFALYLRDAISASTLVRLIGGAA